jgi:transposase
LALGTPSRVRRPRELALQEARRARRLARYAAVVARREQGASLRAIAGDLRLSRTTALRHVRAARAGGLPERPPRAPRPTQLTRFDAYLRERWAAGCHNALALWRELQGRGFTGARTSVRDYVQRWRPAPSTPPASGVSSTCSSAPSQTRAPHGRRDGAAAAPNTPGTTTGSPSVREVTWRLLRRPDELTTDEQDYVATLVRHCPEVGVAHGLVQDLAALVRERDRWPEDPGALASWVHVARASDVPELRSFAAGLLRDWAAVQAALTSPWSNGQTEGQVTRLKLLKRQMYGRAKFDLLRKRVLAPP